MSVFLTESEAKERLESKSNLINYEKVVRPKIERKSRPRGLPNPNAGRHHGQTNLSSFTQELIGSIAHYDRTKNVAKHFGVAGQTVTNIKSGVVKNATAPNDCREVTVKVPVRDAIKRNLEEIGLRASDQILKTLGILEDRIESVEKPTELSNIAKNLSSVLEKSQPKETPSMQNNVIVHLHGVEKFDKDKFEAIDVYAQSLED